MCIHPNGCLQNIFLIKIREEEMELVITIPEKVIKHNDNQYKLNHVKYFACNILINKTKVAGNEQY